MTLALVLAIEGVKPRLEGYKQQNGDLALPVKELKYRANT